MTNLTISVDPAVVRAARVRAVAEGTTVSARIRDYLAAYGQGAQVQWVAVADPAAGRLARRLNPPCASGTPARHVPAARGT